MSHDAQHSLAGIPSSSKVAKDTSTSCRVPARDIFTFNGCPHRFRIGSRKSLDCARAATAGALGTSTDYHSPCTGGDATPPSFLLCSDEARSRLPSEVDTANNNAKAIANADTQIDTDPMLSADSSIVLSSVMASPVSTSQAVMELSLMHLHSNSPGSTDRTARSSEMGEEENDGGVVNAHTDWAIPPPQLQQRFSSGIKQQSRQEGKGEYLQQQQQRRRRLPLPTPDQYHVERLPSLSWPDEERSSAGVNGSIDERGGNGCDPGYEKSLMNEQMAQFASGTNCYGMRNKGYEAGECRDSSPARVGVFMLFDETPIQRTLPAWKQRFPQQNATRDAPCAHKGSPPLPLPHASQPSPTLDTSSTAVHGSDSIDKGRNRIAASEEALARVANRIRYEARQRLLARVSLPPHGSAAHAAAAAAMGGDHRRHSDTSADLLEAVRSQSSQQAERTGVRGPMSVSGGDARQETSFALDGNVFFGWIDAKGGLANDGLWPDSPCPPLGRCGDV